MENIVSFTKELLYYHQLWLSQPACQHLECVCMYVCVCVLLCRAPLKISEWNPCWNIITISQQSPVSCGSFTLGHSVIPCLMYLPWLLVHVIFIATLNWETTCAQLKLRQHEHNSKLSTPEVCKHVAWRIWWLEEWRWRVNARCRGQIVMRMHLPHMNI